MMTIPGYTLIAPVCESGDLLLYQGISAVDNRPILLKIPAGSSPHSLSRLEHEYELARPLDPRRIARPLALERHGNQVALVLEPGPIQTLESRLGLPMDIHSFLRIAIGITVALGELHRHEYVHKDLKPEHVLLDADDHVWLTGMGVASPLPRESQPLEPPEAITVTLTYMAPEQTGRMNRSIDSRSDLYALGVVFYEMLTGVLPFVASDPMELLYCHIALEPVPAVQRVPTLPEPISEMVIKLLAKTAEDRYQSTAGLNADLRHCLTGWESNGHIAPFPLGTHDTPDRLLMPEKLYGRKAEIETLLAAFERVVVSGDAELVLVSGYSGIGKTSVVHELHKALVPHRGFFAAGKFDLYKRDIPYATLVQALQTLIRQILCKNEAEIEAWREALQKALSPNGQLIVSLIPEVELIIGEQPPVPELPPQEARIRFRMVLLRFIGVFAGPEHPLVLFLDDLQWLDTATLELLEHLGSKQDVRHLLLIGAYRDNEVGPAHPLMHILETVREAGAGLREIVLAPLSIDDVCDLIADLLRCDPKRALPLARLVHEKTGGNPFFTIQFLTALGEEKLLALNHAEGRWTWDMASILAKGYTDNVVDLMVGKLSRLPTETLEVLKLFACLGNMADLATLSLVCEQSEETLQAGLWEAAKAGLVLRREKAYTFLHDRVQEAAYALVPENRRKELHLKIGRIMSAQYPPEMLAEQVFHVVDQFNRSVELITNLEERATLRRLNTAAGKKARNATAYASGQRYLEQARALLPPDFWNECYPESLGIYLALAECESLIGNYERADTLLTEAIERAGSLADRAGLYSVRMRLYQISGRYREAIGLSYEVLKLFGLTFPQATEDARAATEAELTLVAKNMGDRRIADLCDIPPTDNVQTRALIGLLNDIMPLMYAVRPDIWTLFTAKAVNVCLQHGHGAESSLLYACFAMALAGDIPSIPTAQQYAEMAIELNEKTLEAAPVKGKVLFFYATTVIIWRKHFTVSLPLLEQAFRACLDFGDMVIGVATTRHGIWLHLESGALLEHVIEVARRYIAFTQEIHNNIASHLNQLELHFALALQGKTKSLADFSNDTFDEASSVEALEQAGYNFGIAFYRVMKQVAAYFDQRYDEALEWAERMVPMLINVRSCANEATYHFFHALTLAALYAQAPAEKQHQYAQTITEILGKLKAWAVNCPENFDNRYFLVSAEIARIEGRDLEAMRLYDQAINSARENDFVQQEALAAEVAAWFYEARGFEKIARVYLRDAHAGYSRWGAEGKVRQLERLHLWLAQRQPRQTTTLAQQLDALTVAKAQQAISSEISFDRLAQTLLRLVMESSGAQSGILLVEGAGQLKAWLEPDDNGTQGILFDDAPPATDLPAAIINYVRRSRQTVCLDDAHTNAGEFANDDYLRHSKPRSVLAMAIQRKEKLQAVLYLENNLVGGAFTAEQRAVLEVLAAQAAISLEISAVYETLRDNEERMRLTLSATQIGTFDWDVELDIWSASPVYYTMLGYEPQKGPGDREEWVARLHPDDRTLFYKKLQSVVSKNIADYQYEARLRHADGSYRWQFIKGFGIQRDAQGKITRMLGIRMDIHERKIAEEKLFQLTNELEKRVKERTADLEKKNIELERINNLFVGRELRMVELKKQIKELEKKLDT